MKSNNRKGISLILLLTAMALFVVIGILLLADQQKDNVKPPKQTEQQTQQVAGKKSDYRCRGRAAGRRYRKRGCFCHNSGTAAT